MSAYTNCPACEKLIRVPQLGVRILCPLCNAKVQIPDDDVPLAVVLEDDEALVDSQPESSSFNPAVGSLDRTEPALATQTVPVSAMTKRLRKRRSLPTVEPPNFFETKWYHLLLLRRRRVLQKPRSSLPFKLLAVYAVVVTVATVALLLHFLLTRSSHALESLPDLKPALRYKPIPKDADLAPGHELRLAHRSDSAIW